MEIDAAKNDAVLNGIVAPLPELADAFIVVDTVAAEGKVLNAVAVAIQEICVDRLPPNRLDDLSIHVLAVGEA